MKRKYLVTSVLIVVCIAVLVVPYIVSSQSSNGLPYDPWYDVNDDGKINMKDIGALCLHYGTESEDTTKNVYVTNFPLDEEGNLRVNSTCCSSYPNSNVTYKDVAEITVLEWSVILYNGNEEGVILYTSHTWCLLPFDFSPKGQLINVTDVWIVVTESIHTTGMSIFDIIINDNLTITISKDHVDPYIPVVITIHREDLYQLIHPDINTLEFGNVRGVSNTMFLYKIVIFIEYEYQA